jgi:hypothetical protein
MSSTVLIRKPEGKTRLGISMTRSEDNVKIDLKEISGGLWTVFLWSDISTG